MKNDLFAAFCLFLVGCFGALWLVGAVVLLGGCATHKQGAKLPAPIAIELERKAP